MQEVWCLHHTVRKLTQPRKDKIMATKTECDRCKDSTADINPRAWTRLAVSRSNRKTPDWYDLCPGCTQAITTVLAGADVPQPDKELTPEEQQRLDDILLTATLVDQDAPL